MILRLSRFGDMLVLWRVHSREKNECRSKKGTVFVKEMNHLTTVDLQARLYTKTINNNAMFHHDFYFV